MAHPSINEASPTEQMEGLSKNSPQLGSYSLDEITQVGATQEDSGERSNPVCEGRGVYQFFNVPSHVSMNL